MAGAEAENQEHFRVDISLMHKAFWILLKHWQNAIYSTAFSTCFLLSYFSPFVAPETSSRARYVRGIAVIIALPSSSNISRCATLRRPGAGSPLFMLPVRLLALTVYGYLAPVLRKPLRPQLHRCQYHHHHNPFPSTRTSATSAIRGLTLPSVFARMASTGHHHESVETTPNRTDGEQARAAADLDLANAADVYRYLRGDWKLEKSIDYKVGGMAGSWRGVASFSPPHPLPPLPQQQQQEEPAADAAAGDNDDETMDPSLLLRYLEQGVFRINGTGAGFEAGQRLVYDCGNSSGRVRVHFVDDPEQPNKLRFFHELDFRRPGTDLAAAATTSTATAAATAGAPGGSEFQGEGEGCPSYGGGKAAAAAVGIDMRRPRAEFEHLCVRDMYRGQVEVVGPDEFKTRRVFDRAVCLVCIE